MLDFPLAKFAVAERHLLPFELEDIKRLRRFGKKRHVNERRLARENGAPAFDADVEKDEGRPVMRAAAHDFAHLLRDDARHRMDGLKDRAQPLREIRDRDSVPGAKKNDHRFADDATESE